MKRILVTGSRDWEDAYVIHRAILHEVQVHIAMVVHGGARGADRIAGQVAEILWLPVEVYDADWESYGRRAGMVRNQKMVDAGADVCLAFIRNNSRGASDCARRAELAGIPVRYFRIEDGRRDVRQ